MKKIFERLDLMTLKWSVEDISLSYFCASDIDFIYMHRYMHIYRTYIYIDIVYAGIYT